MKRNLLPLLIVLFYPLAKVIYLIAAPAAVGSSNWLIPLLNSILYLLIGIFILLASDTFGDYNIDPLSLIFFLLFSTILRIEPRGSSTGFGTILRVANWLIGGIILLRIFRKELPFSRPTANDYKRLGVGLLFGLVLAIPLAYLVAHKPGLDLGSLDWRRYTSVGQITSNFLYLASSAAVLEEFTFRGVLWGYLAKLTGNDERAWIVQGLAYWLFHFDRILVSPLGFWITVPVGAILFSLLARRFRSLAPSIAAHATLDTAQLVLTIVFAASR